MSEAYSHLCILIKMYQDEVLKRQTAEYHERVRIYEKVKIKD